MDGVKVVTRRFFGADDVDDGGGTISSVLALPNFTSGFVFIRHFYLSMTTSSEARVEAPPQLCQMLSDMDQTAENASAVGHVNVSVALNNRAGRTSSPPLSGEVSLIFELSIGSRIYSALHVTVLVHGEIARENSGIIDFPKKN